jgi:hypothetical protein
VSSFAGDLELSAAGVDQGHRAFQEFLLAGERHIVAGFARPGAEAAFAQTYSQLPDNTQALLTGYFRRQAQLDLSQRAALLGPFVKLQISNALAPGIARKIDPPRPSVRAELDSLGPRKFGGLSPDFSKVKGSIADAVADAASQGVKLAPGKPVVRFVELLLDDITVENSQDDSLFKNDTDEVTLGVTMLDEKGAVTTANHNLGSIEEGKTKKFTKPLVLGSLPVSTAIKGFPRSYYFKVDAVDRDDGGYNDLLKAGAEYIQKKVTQELIAAGIIKAGQTLGIPIPPQVANYIASYLKSWFDSLIDWFEGLLKDEDDILGSRTRHVQLTSAAFALTERFLIGVRTTTAQKSPLSGFPFSWTFSGGDGRWRTRMHVQLR